MLNSQKLGRIRDSDPGPVLWIRIKIIRIRPQDYLKTKKYQYFFFFINFKNINSNFLKNTKTLI